MRCALASTTRLLRLPARHAWRCCARMLFRCAAAATHACAYWAGRGRTRNGDLRHSDAQRLCPAAAQRLWRRDVPPVSQASAHIATCLARITRLYRAATTPHIPADIAFYPYILSLFPSNRAEWSAMWDGGRWLIHRDAARRSVLLAYRCGGGGRANTMGRMVVTDDSSTMDAVMWRMCFCARAAIFTALNAAAGHSGGPDVGSGWR